MGTAASRPFSTIEDGGNDNRFFTIWKSETHGKSTCTVPGGLLS